MSALMGKSYSRAHVNSPARVRRSGIFCPRACARTSRFGVALGTVGGTLGGMKAHLPVQAALLVVALAWNCAAWALTIDFNNYGGPANNDLVNNFNSVSEFEQTTSGGITGGYVIPLQPEGSMTYKTEFHLPLAEARNTSVAFRFDPSMVSPEDFNTVSIQFSGGGVTAISYVTRPDSGSAANARIQAGALGGQEITLVEGRWYRLSLQLTRLADAFGRAVQTTRLDDLGADGLDGPSLIWERSGDIINSGLLSDSLYHCTIYANAFGGCVAIDDFTIDIPGEPTPTRPPLILAYRFDETRIDVGETARTKSRSSGYFLADVENNAGVWFHVKTSRAARTFYRRREPSLIVSPPPRSGETKYLVLGAGETSGVLPGKTARLLQLRGTATALNLPTRDAVTGARTLAGVFREMTPTGGRLARESSLGCRLDKPLTDRIDTAGQTITQAEDALAADLTTRGFTEVPDPE